MIGAAALHGWDVFWFIVALVAAFTIGLTLEKMR